MNNPKLYYQESGHVGVQGPVLMVLAGTASAAILGAVYGYAIYLIPFIYLNFIITIFFGGALGFVVGKMGAMGKVRNGLAMMGFGLLIGIIGEYFGWVFWIHAASEQEVLDFNPGNIFYTMGDIAENGLWGIFGWVPTGAALYIIWVIEAAIIIGAATLAVFMGGNSEPFCETCQQWTESTTLSDSLQPIPDLPSFVSAMEQKDFQPLKNLPATEHPADAFTRIKLMSCPNCQNAHFLSAEAVSVSYDEDGKREEDETTFMEHLIVDTATANDLKKWSEGQEASA